MIDLFVSDGDFTSHYLSTKEFGCAGCLRKRTTVGSLVSWEGGGQVWVAGLCMPCDKVLQSPAYNLSDRQAKADKIVANLEAGPRKLHPPRERRD